MDKYIIINSGENLESQIYRVAKKTNLSLKPGSGYLPKDVNIKTNYPTKGSKFDRNFYHELAIVTDHQDLISSSLNWHTALKLEIAGTFHFICYHDGEPIWRAYIIVDPDLKIPIDKIRAQTVLTKNLGPFKEWRKRLTITKELKYNVIHFTPVQELGASNSAYSLSNQLKINPSIKASLDDIKKEVDFMDKKWSVLSVTDIVLNHTADDSVWIREHPECAYNTANSPHLRPAALLDSAFIWLMKDMISGNLLQTDGLSDRIETELDLQTISVLLKTFYVPQLKIWEMFMVDIGAAIKQFEDIERGDQLVIDYDQYQRNAARVKLIPEDVATPDDLEHLLQRENFRKREEIKECLDYAIKNAISAMRYERLNRGPLNSSTPLVAPYFSHTNFADFNIVREENIIFNNGEKIMAHNGWVMGGPSNDDSIYLKRELIAWGDCIKLRYGRGPQDVPFLWDYMRRYVEAQAKVFHGLRIDNCHSTPLHVAEYMLDAARLIRPDIYIMGELFTSSEAADNIFVNRLGITSLIRESMSAHNARELGRMMYRYGGTPVGAFYQEGAECLRPSVAHAIFYDQTHDNESPVVKRSAHDVAATASIISMANCATGTNRGYDELVPHHINVVTEDRLYVSDVDESCGILPLRKILNGQLQRELQGFDEIFVDQVNDDVIAITRHNPIDGRSIVLVGRTAFSKMPAPCPLRPIHIQGTISRILFEAQSYGDPDKYERNQNYINGLSSFKTKIFTSNASPGESKLATLKPSTIELDEFKFLPSSVLAVEICLSESQTEALKMLNQWQIQIDNFNLTMSDVNYILFRCASEDNLEPYELPGMCKFTYAGLYGLMYHLEKVRENQDQAHPLAMNLREGGWMSDYIVARLRRRPSTEPLANHLELALKQVQLLPRGMVPKYFDLIISKTYRTLVDFIYTRMSVFVSRGPKLVRLLALASVALVGECESAPMPACETNLSYIPSIAAGLPHFSSGYMRNWGRDTFIALRGLLLITGRYAEAKAILLSYGRTLKHGLIPNLLDGGVRARYNCRDAIWWWLYSVREYTKLAPNGAEILKCKLKRLHKPEQSGLRKRAKMNHQEQQLCETIQEALECHFNGKEFTEENAGKQLDEHMLPEGFVVTYGVDRNTGFVYGGNSYNCGTWMDKMGSSEKAATKGLPASSRDGSAIEIVALCKAVVSWLDELHKAGLYHYDGVETIYDKTIPIKCRWNQWANRIQSNFERLFYIPLEGGSDANPQLINRRGIYKDTLGANPIWQDYQLRPNFLVAMVVAPELFDPEHARSALRVAKRYLCGPLGMRTLDPSDHNYCGDYDNSNDTANKKVAHGYNYHQGPEWLWLTGYYIRASQKFLGASERNDHLQILSRFQDTLCSSPWFGLPELTNTNGSPCLDSCPIQAWSLGTALEALHERTPSG